MNLWPHLGLLVGSERCSVAKDVHPMHGPGQHHIDPVARLQKPNVSFPAIYIPRVQSQSFDKKTWESTAAHASRAICLLLLQRLFGLKGFLFLKFQKYGMLLLSIPSAHRPQDRAAWRTNSGLYWRIIAANRLGYSEREQILGQPVEWLSSWPYLLFRTKDRMMTVLSSPCMSTINTHVEMIVPKIWTLLYPKFLR